MKCPHCNSKMVVWGRDDQDRFNFPVRDVPHWFCKSCNKWIRKWIPGDSEED